MRLQEALSRVQVDELAQEGYNSAFFAPSPVGQKAIAIASHGLSSLQDSVQQAVRVQNLEFRLALKPHGGWNDKTKLVLESLASWSTWASKRAWEKFLSAASLR